MDLFHKSRPQEKLKCLGTDSLYLGNFCHVSSFSGKQNITWEAGSQDPTFPKAWATYSTAKRPGNDDNPGPERQLIVRKTSDWRLDRSAAATTLAHTHRPLRQLFDLAIPWRYCRECKMKMWQQISLKNKSVTSTLWKRRNRALTRCLLRILSSSSKSESDRILSQHLDHHDHKNADLQLDNNDALSEVMRALTKTRGLYERWLAAGEESRQVL